MNDKGEAVKWLIEITSQNTAVIYYFGVGSFTIDAHIAMSFDTEKETIDYIKENQNMLSSHSVKAREHMFLQ